MKYNLVRFNSAVAYYKRALKGKAGKGKTCLVVLPMTNKKAFFSIAPLSRALHESGCDVNVFAVGWESRSLPVLLLTWKLFGELKQGRKTKATAALHCFIQTVERKAGSKYFSKLFEQPDLQIAACSDCFKSGGAELHFKNSWFRERKWKQLSATAKRILLEGYGLKKMERFSIGFELIPKKKDLQLPLQDYLDSYAIAYAFATQANKLCGNVSLGADTARMSQLLPADRISDLSATLIGCEYEKKIGEPWFKAFRRLSPFICAQRLRPSDASLGIYGKGYGGKHFFGLKIGYPTPNRKSRWQGPGQMFLKPWWLQQTKHDNRKPLTRNAITETLPIENFIRTCNIDYAALKRKDQKIKGILLRCVKLFVKGRQVKGGRTMLQLDLRFLRGGKLPVLVSDVEFNPRAPPEAGKAFKVKAGKFGNIPGGEVFFTPHKMDGTVVGDIIINIDQSYVIGGKQPLVIKITNGRYKVVGGRKAIINTLNKKKKDSWKLIKLYEKNKSMPKSIINSMKGNFDRIGEFAINTNPKARLSRYLIETEKMARMIHIALGSGFEPGRETAYHYDIAINSPRQRLDIYGVDPKGKEHWIIKKGKMVI